MKTAYFHCYSGISGDMVIGAMLDAGLDLKRLQEELSKLNISGFRLEQSRVTRGGLSATKFDVISTEAGNDWRKPGDILKVIQTSSLSQKIKDRAGRIFTVLATAEAAVHGVPLAEVHFHELGTIDTIIDAVGAATALELMEIEKVLSSPVNLGSGTVQTAHGRLPVPVPAALELLKGKPVYSAGAQVELTTPTGAAILSALAEGFGHLPQMEVQAVGYGAGARDFPEMPNLLRVFIGFTGVEEDADTVAVLEANIDDMNPELYTPFIEKAMGAGALDVFLTPIIMKKGRPGVKVTILTELSHERRLRALLFTETTTFGLRARYESREKLKREIVEIETPYGIVKVKLGKMGGKIIQVSPEAESCLQIANLKKVPLKLVYDEAKKAAQHLLQ